MPVPEHKRDPKLADKLRAEWPGILRWAISGCLEWQRIGLAAPGKVRLATQTYLEAEDIYGRWIAERCDTTAADGKAALKDLYADFRAWGIGAGERRVAEITARKLGENLEEKGFSKKRETEGNKIMGLTLIQRM